MPENKKTNVLILFTDQQRYDTVNASGYPHMITPNLDRLAGEGCNFTCAHSTNPVCMPARHDLITGLSGRQHGYFTNAKQPIKEKGLPTLPEIFLENGYRTAVVGKMHFFPAREHHGFGEMHLMEELPVCRQDDQYALFLEENGLGDIQNLHGVRPYIYHTPQVSQTEEKYHGSTWVADKTLQWLKENDDKPFFLFASWIHPHPPWNLPPDYKDLYKGRDIPEPVQESRGYPYTTQKSEWYGDDDTAEMRRKTREAYYSAVTMVDKNIGRVLDYMEESGLLENTLIIFTSDHGEMLQDKGFFQKHSPYEGAIRVPFIVRYPEKFKPGTQSEDFVDLFDVMPTCLDVCGLKYPSEKYSLAGGSLCSDTGRDRSRQCSSFGKGSGRWVMARNKRYKYIYRYNNGTEEMYDMQCDPKELKNLIPAGTYSIADYNDLKSHAAEYESNLGPEGNIGENGSFIACPDKELHPNVHAKFSFWQNMQFQYFDDSGMEHRGEEYIREVRHALTGHDNGKVLLNETLDNEEWKKQFRESWEKYSGNDRIKDILKD